VVGCQAGTPSGALGADYALAISGIAGPDGGTPQKPVGTVCIALACRTADGQIQVSARTHMLAGDREMIRDRAAKMALAMLRWKVMEEKVSSE